MKTLIPILTSILLASCGSINKVESPDSKIINLESKYDTTYYYTRSLIELNGIVILDNCEYISGQTSYGYNVLTHKGNCNNPIHKCKCD
jgi:hypothetical protein